MSCIKLKVAFNQLSLKRVRQKASYLSGRKLLLVARFVIEDSDRCERAETGYRFVSATFSN